MVYIDHQGISFSNENCFPKLEDLSDDYYSYLHNKFILQISNFMAGFAIRNRAQSFKKDKLRVSLFFFFLNQ